MSKPRKPTPSQMRKIEIIRQMLGIRYEPATHGRAWWFIHKHYPEAAVRRQYTQIKQF